MDEPANVLASRHSGALVIRNVSKNYGLVRVVDDVCISVERGKVLALLGPSGCGKTTLLKMIAGLVDPTAGDITVDGESIVDLPPHKRRFGMLFQNYALFPHLNVFSNVMFGLELQGVARTEAASRARKALERVELGGFAERMPHELSGGQQQRVALARALVYEPRLLLLDEPFAALDKNLREGMQFELRSICNQLDLTTVLVTHDQDEALTLADEIAVMRNGRIEQVGVAREVYDRPQTTFVADFIGKSNFFSGSIVARNGEQLSIRGVDGLYLRAECPERGGRTDDAVMVAVRPEAIALVPSDAGYESNFVTGRVRQVVFRGATITTVLSLSDNSELICASAVGSLPRMPAVGETWGAHWPIERAIVVEISK